MRRVTQMTIQCARYTVTVNPYVQEKRRKTFDLVAADWEYKLAQHKKLVDNIALLTDIEVKDTFEMKTKDMFNVLGLAETQEQRVNIANAMVNGTLDVKPVFTHPDKKNKWSMKAYRLLVTQEMYRLFLVRAGTVSYTHLKLPTILIV